MSCPSTVEALLVRGRNRLARGHCKGACARNHLGDVTVSDAASAKEWCMLGAIQCPQNLVLQYQAKEVLEDVLPCTPRGNKCVPITNDAVDTTQEMVLGWFDAAIEKVRSGQI